MLATGLFVTAHGSEPRCLPGEPSAEDVLNGGYSFPPSPGGGVIKANSGGFAADRISQAPPAGVHPRILLSPSDLPDLRRRLKETDAGRTMIGTLRARTLSGLHTPGTWENELFNKLASGDAKGALAILDSNQKPNGPTGHYQPYVLYSLVMEAFDAMVRDDAEAGKRVAAAIATYAAMVRPLLDKALDAPLNDDVWRVKVSGPTTGNWSDSQGIRDLMGYHNLGYAYDFAYNFMDDAQRKTVRDVIAKATAGRLWMGARLPHHFRNWNWIAVGLSQPLLALAIEGEEGYDPRVYKLGAQIAKDYLTYGISPSGCSTEAVGYTQFGLVWANPFFVAAARRGDNLLTHPHHRAMVDWYLQSMDPAGGSWTSHGDGGDRPPAVWTALMWKHFFPDDPKIDFLLEQVRFAGGGDQLKERIHIIEPLVWAEDSKNGKMVPEGMPLVWFDPLRSSLIARSSWEPDAACLQFECRTDSVGSSHEHADRGNFTFSALGRTWAKENFRSVETRHHNGLLIDGLGQGFWPGPGNWLGLQEEDGLVIAACDAKEAYGWRWPKQIVTEDPASFIRFKFPRWESYGTQALDFRNKNGSGPFERDTRPSVVNHWKGFEKGDPRMWDEDAWPVRLPHNPVRRAFRTVVFNQGKSPWLLVADDVQKDDKERLYEWLMQTGPDTEIVSISGNDVVLGDATLPRDSNGTIKPKKGDRLLLVRILDMNMPAAAADYQSTPSVRLETFERKDTLEPEQKDKALSGARSFGLDKRLVVASRSVAPDFKILLFPHRAGEALPVTAWSDDRSVLTVTTGGEVEKLRFNKTGSGLSRITRTNK